MLLATTQLMNALKDPVKEIEIVRRGISPNEIENFLLTESFAVNDILTRLQISKTTYFTKKKKHTLLDTNSTEKFLRLISVVQMAREILGQKEAKAWLYQKIASLGNEVPVNLLDTEAGHRLVEQALLQIKYGVYN